MPLKKQIQNTASDNYIYPKFLINTLRFKRIIMILITQLSALSAFSVPNTKEYTGAYLIYNVKCVYFIAFSNLRSLPLVKQLNNPTSLIYMEHWVTFYYSMLLLSLLAASQCCSCTGWSNVARCAVCSVTFTVSDGPADVTL